MARRRRYADSETDQLQRFKAENQKLKRELAKLKKQISRFDLDRFESFKEALDRIDELEMTQAAKKAEKVIEKNKWSCWQCEEGTLKLQIYDRLDGVFYQRCCDTVGCRKRTRVKKWTPEVEKE